ncbi:MAG: D-gamma-glutamyl-meso-diaminopimelic acid endopeptidase CwlS [Chlamydiae bacterium]|nr:D-gamma-glutamyl-meso-diaminopimelic acid endopeptidase CwlS [Chlamydiota bacterium]
MGSNDQNWIKRARWLSGALIISGTLNIGFLTTFIYMVLKEKERPLPIEITRTTQKSPRDPSANLNMQQLLSKYSTLSFQELMVCLGNSDHIESGYTKRDLALACLVSFHHFNLERALGGLKLQRRTIAFTNSEAGEKIQLDIFAGLADYQYQAISSYAKTEKWPLTPQGLFFELKSMTPPFESTLLEAFYLTPEFHFLSTLFSKSGVSLRKESLALLLSEGRWETIREYAALLRSTSEFTPSRRREFLLQLVDEESRLAARLLVKLDEEIALHQFDDEQILSLLDLLRDKVPEPFVKTRLTNPRSDQIWKKAQKAVGTPMEVPKKEEPLKELVAPKQIVHTVATGDSLWKIARKYQISVSALQEKNALKTDRLRPGQELIIP